MNASIAIDTLLQEVNTLTRKLAEAEATIKRLDDENTTLVCRMLDRGKRIEEMERLQRDNEFLIAECGNLSDSRVDTMKNLKASQERVKELEDLLREARGHIHDEYCCAFGDMSLENKIEAALTQPQEKQV
jgi:DNA repair ATPase RecN